MRGDDTGSNAQLLGALVLGLVEALGPGANTPTQSLVSRDLVDLAQWSANLLFNRVKYQQSD